jgi:hypothetical protein
LGILQTQTWPDDDGNNVKDDTSDHIGISSHQMSRFYDHHTIFVPFSDVFSEQKFSSCSTPVDVWSCEALVGLFLWKQGLQDEY